MISLGVAPGPADGSGKNHKHLRVPGENAVVDGLETTCPDTFTGEPMGEMPPCRKSNPQDRVTGLEQGPEKPAIAWAPLWGLHVGPWRPEQLGRAPGDRQLLDRVNVLTKPP